MSADKKNKSLKNQQKKSDNRVQKSSSKKKEELQKKDLFDYIDYFLKENQKKFFWISMICATLFSILLFDIKVSVGGDDSAYVIRAYDFIKDFRYPSFQGPLYPMVLGLIIGVFGINLPILKALSLIFMVLHFYFFHKTFKDRIPPMIYYPSFLLISLNAYLLYYSSQTYSESFYLLLQVLFFYLFFKFFITDYEENIAIKKDYKKFILLGITLFLMCLTKTVGYGALITAMVYFIVYKHWKSIGLTIGSFFVFQFIWEIIKRLLMNTKDLQFSSQIKTLLQKHPYDPSQGQEDIIGFLNRFADNSNIYFSKHLYKFLGLRPEITDPLPVLTVLTFIFFGLAFYWAFKKNKHLLFTGFYLTVMLGITFFMIQKLWDSGRMVIIFFPFLLIFLSSGLYYLSKSPKFISLQSILPTLFVVFFIATLIVTTDQVKQKQVAIRANLSGDLLYGFTPDYVNFIKMSQWAAVNCPQDVKIASRKPDISFIYTNRRFWGMYNVPTENADTLLNILKKNNVRYVIMASLRKFEKEKTEYTINTEQRFLYYIQQKYPDKISQVTTIGADETATLFEIK
jgi:hypothetical protein